MIECDITITCDNEDCDEQKNVQVAGDPQGTIIPADWLRVDLRATDRFRLLTQAFGVGTSGGESPIAHDQFLLCPEHAEELVNFLSNQEPTD